MVSTLHSRAMLQKLFTLVLVCLGFICIVSSENAENPEVTYSLGKAKGSVITSRLGKKIHSFRGLRYAEGPIGPLRFKVAVPAKPWSGVFDASEEGPSCPGDWTKNNSDDCLRLNVYSTKLGAETKRPVIVFLHPGGFFGFSGQSYIFGPQYLLDEDVVLVTINFRLGAIGFIATGDASAPGNLGLKDQVEALRWVQRNIESFGGDKNSVTIVGYSSGAWSTVYHMLSPMSKGLFHRAVSMSGSPITPEPMATEGLYFAKQKASSVGCPNDTTAAMIKCLENVPFEKMRETFLENNNGWNGLAKDIPWFPVVEPEIPGVERFIVGQPADLIRQGKLHKVPFMTGSTKDEFAVVAALPIVEAQKGNYSLFNDLNENFDSVAPLAFRYERNTTKSKRISAEIKELYFKGETIGLNNSEKLMEMFADSITKFGVDRTVNLIAANTDQPVYYYNFVYEGRYTFYTYPDSKKPIGVSQNDDLMYLFFMKEYFPYFEPNSPEIPTVERMTAMWASFAKTGNPIPKNNSQFKGITWNQFTPENKKYLEINETLAMKTNVDGERMEALSRIFPLSPLPRKH